MKVSVGISNRHVHLTIDAYKFLFDGKEIEKRNDLNQIGEFASTDVVTIEYNGKCLENVRVVGPFRSHNQIELLRSDLEFLGLNAPVRRSGDLDSTPSVTVKVKDKSLVTDGVIRAERHVHVPKSKEDDLNLHERDVVTIEALNKKFKANVKVSDNGFFELHIDKDEALEYGISNKDEVEITHVENR